MNRSISLIDRRRFLGLGALCGVLGLVGVAGCESSDTIGTPQGPPTLEGGNRKRMEKKLQLGADAKDKDKDKDKK